MSMGCMMGSNGLSGGHLVKRSGVQIIDRAEKLFAYFCFTCILSVLGYKMSVLGNGKVGSEGEELPPLPPSCAEAKKAEVVNASYQSVADSEVLLKGLV